MSGELRRLTEYLKPLAGGGLCVAFSGGVDSAVLLRAACLLGGEVHAVTLCTPFHTRTEPREAAAMAEKCGARHAAIAIEEIPPGLRDNPPERCYLCKRELFERILEYARDNGLASVLDGTNGDDLGQHRPGLAALRELGVKSPLAELGLSKQQVRAIAAELGLEAASKPSAPCLATRFPYGERLTPGKLRQAEEIEEWIRSALGVPVVRARIHSGIARLEVEPRNFDRLLQGRAELIEMVKKAGLHGVSLDLEGFRSGSMDELYDYTKEQAEGR